MRFFLFLLLFAPLLRANELATLEDLTAQWVALRAEQSREREAWNDEQSRLRLENSLLENAEKRLQNERNELRAGGDAAEANQAQLLQELSERTEALEVLRPDLDAAHARLLQQVKALPEPLRRILDAELQAAESAPAEPVQRLRVTLALHHQFIALQRGIHTAPMVLDLNGERREMDILWIGAQRAYATAAEGDLAAVGSVHDGVWSWKALPGHAPRIRQALRIARGEAPPSLVTLPLEAAP